MRVSSTSRSTRAGSIPIPNVSAAIAPISAPEYLAFGTISVEIAVHVDHLPSAGEKITLEPIGEYPGGMGANAASSFAALGGRAGVAATIGDDAHGRASLADLARRGVDTRWVQTVLEPTFHTIALVSRAGDTALLEFPIPEPDQAYGRLEQRAFDGLRFIHVVASEGAPALGVLQEARRRGITTAVDLEAFGLQVPCLGELLKETDILFVNAMGARHFGTPIDRALAELRSSGPATILVTLGAAGCVIAGPTGDPVEIPGHQVESVDATGAGDCFAGAFAYGFTQGWPDIESAVLANLMAALSTTAVGSRGHLASPAELGAIARSTGLTVGARLP